MSIVDITPAVELEFVFGSGTWTDVTALYIDSQSNVQWQRGVGEDRTPQTSTASFNLDNASEVWTPGNTASSFYNKLRKGIGVRISSTYSATKRYHFRGVVTEVRARFPDWGPSNMRVDVSCEGISSLLGVHEAYGMAVQENKDIDDILAAIMTAAGSTHYSFEDSNLTLPVVIPRSDPLSDLVAVALSEPASALWEDGEGRMRWKKAENMTGGYSSPAHTWGTTIVPEGGVTPDYRNDAQFARQRVTRSALTVGSQEVELYRHPYNWQNKTSEALASQEQRRIAGTFSRFPSLVQTKFVQTIQAFVQSGTSLYAAIDATQTYLYTNLGTYNQFVAGSIIRIDSEAMLVTSASPANAATTNQRLDVTRAYLGTVAAAHTAPANPVKLIYHRPPTQVVGVVVGYLVTSITTTGTTFNLTGGAGGGTPNAAVRYLDILKIDNELMTVTSGNALPPVVTRGDYGTAKTTHAANAPAYRITLAQLGDSLGATHVLSSDQPDTPPSSPDIVGVAAFPGAMHITYSGNKFLAMIYNQSASVRYNSQLVIGGTVYESTDTPTEIVFEKRIPYILGVPEGPPRSLPYGTSDVQIAKGWAMGLLRAGRIPSGWLEVDLTANVSDNVTSVLTADIGDLVRYTGTGTMREKIDDFYRIVGVAGTYTVDGQFAFRFRLAPAHLNRRADKCWYTSFSSKLFVTGGLGDFDVKGVGSAGWTNSSQWFVQHGLISLGSTGYANVPSVAAPNPALVDAGLADMIVGASIELGVLAQNTYTANTGGVGVTFRSNSGGTQFWEARFNPTQSLIYLWNSTDGVVASVAWSATADPTPEIEVWARGNLIQVYAGASGNPVITATSTRFNANTWFGPALERTIVSGAGAYPWFRDIYGQAV